VNRLKTLAALGAMVAASTLSGVAQDPKPGQQPAPVFRGGAHYVRVDAHPTLGGEIIRGLTKDDFELFEDGKPQTISAADFVTFDTKDEARGSMLSARRALELAADPGYRVVIFVVDRAVFDSRRWHEMREDLDEFLATQVGPRDLVGLITTDRPWTELSLGRPIDAIRDEIDRPDWLNAEPQEQTAILRNCELEGLRGRIRADETYALLEGLVQLFAQVREDRTSIVFISNGLSRAAPDMRYGERRKMAMPPKLGLVNGRIQRIARPSDMRDRFCEGEGRRLAETNFDRRFSELVNAARAANVIFYPVGVPFFQMEATRGMPVVAGGRSGFGVAPPPARMSTRVSGTLEDLAKATDGFLLHAERDVAGGLRLAAAETGPHYLLGYYTTNEKRDGKIRSIKVRLKKNGADIQARRFYRAPTDKEIAALSAPRPPEAMGSPPEIAEALGPLSRIRRSTQFFTYAALSGQSLTVVVEVPYVAVQAGRWKDGAALEVLAEGDSGTVVGSARARLTPNGRAVVPVPVDGLERPATVFVRLRADGESIVERADISPEPAALIADPQAQRSSPRGLAIPVALFEFARDERLKVDWPLLAPVERFEVRLLDILGQPLRHGIKAVDQEGAGGRHIVAEMSFTALGRGDYVIELTAIAGSVTERKLLAVRVK
jgi:VWFA-related protein